MTPYLQAVSRLLQSFWQINRSTDLLPLFAPIQFTDITSEADREDAPLAPISVEIRVFSFKDTKRRKAELELNLRQDTGELVNARVQTFSGNTTERDEYFEAHLKPFFAQGFDRVKHPKYPGLTIKEYRSYGLAIGLNCDTNIPFISTYITLEGFH